MDPAEITNTTLKRSVAEQEKLLQSRKGKTGFKLDFSLEGLKAYSCKIPEIFTNKK